MNAVSSEPPESGALLDPSGLPRSFGRYTLFDLVGKGGMAQIYLARAETELGATRLAVVKQILPAFADDPRFAEMLIHEAKLAARLSHRHIVQVFDLGRADDRLFIAMEYVEGFDLNALLRRCTEQKVGLPVEHALGIVADVLEALDYAHRRTHDGGEPLGIVHRDVSPSNVLISYDGEVKLCDFGIAHANDLVREGASEALKGKAGYMSPEHARGETLDARADVFAAGIILWELLAGRRLYKPRSEVPLLEQAQKAEIPPLPLSEKGIAHAEELDRIVLRALAKDPDERYASAAALSRELEAYLVTAGLQANRLKLGEWIAETFGTEMIEQRRASERRLPKSNPPPRSSERVRASKALETSGAASSAVVPAAARVPADLAESVERDDVPGLPRLVEDDPPSDSAPAPPEPTPEPTPTPVEDKPKAWPSGLTTLPISAGAMRAFRETLQEDPPRAIPERDSPEGAPMAASREPESESKAAASPGAAEGQDRKSASEKGSAEKASRVSAEVAKKPVRASDAEMLSWARRHGLWTMLFFLTIIAGLLVALARHLMH